MMKWGRGRRRHTATREVRYDWYAGPHGPELLGVHVTSVIDDLMRGIAGNGELIVPDSFRVTITDDSYLVDDLGDLTIQASITTIGAKS